MGFGIYLSDINGARGRVDQISLWAALTPSGLRRCATRSKCFAFCEPHRFKSKDSSFKLAWAEVFISRILMVPGAGLEPARCCHRGILSPLRLPISPPGHLEALVGIEPTMAEACPITGIH